MSDVLETGGEGEGPMNDGALPATPKADVPSPAMPETNAPPLDDIEREVAEAMASMDPVDLAEICGEIPIDDAAAPSDGDAVEPGTELTGTVAGVSDDEVLLEFSAKSQGVLPRSQFGKKEVIDLGRRVDVVVEKFDPRAGLLFVARKGALQRATWTNLVVGMIVEGRVTGVIKGGLEINLNGIRAFMPASHADLAPMKDISLLLNEMVRCEVMELDRRNKNVLVSRRKVLAKQQLERKEKLIAELEVGQIRHGVVGNITDFGAFVDLGGLDGLVHIRDLSWGTVEKVTDVLSLGQEVDVQVLKVDAKRERISLGLKQVQPDPWQGVEERYPVGGALKTRVIRLADFGAFAELEPGVEGLIPISEMDWSRVRRASDVVSVGDVIGAVVIRLEPDRRRIALSIRQAQPDPWEGVLEAFSEQSLAKGKVTRLTDFGVFVELAPGVEGLLHISELSDRRVKTCSEVVHVGQEVEARVLGVDKENRRISLSLKAAKEEAAPGQTEPSRAEGAKGGKKRKRPLRGGLASHFEW
jgi:small subunit ribosomal protein S1